ncbi:MAG: phosphoribosyl-ATP diphosphatase, partial [Chloroflexota bacterium]
LHELEQIIQERRREMPEGSYTVTLFNKGVNKIAQKVGEEATEVVIAALAEERDGQIGEIADLFYHTLVLMAQLDLSLDDIETKLRERHMK